MRRRSWLAFWFEISLALVAAVVVAEAPKTLGEISAKVVAVTDGDTLTLMPLRESRSRITVRLEGIDAPESKQQHGEKAKDALATMVLNKNITLKKTGEDIYGRTLGVVLQEGKNVNQAMVEDGWAWHFKKYNSDKELAAAEEAARTAKWGLWAGVNILAPWEYRARQKTTEVGPITEHWLNLSTGVRHNGKCQSFKNTKRGRFCEEGEGKACGICGG